ncbi:MAG: hypothetical protein WB791_10565 [Waddliaceae bacterium]
MQPLQRTSKESPGIQEIENSCMVQNGAKRQRQSVENNKSHDLITRALGNGILAMTFSFLPDSDIHVARLTCRQFRVIEDLLLFRTEKLWEIGIDPKKIKVKVTKELFDALYFPTKAKRGDYSSKSLRTANQFEDLYQKSKHFLKIALDFDETNPLVSDAVEKALTAAHQIRNRKQKARALHEAGRVLALKDHERALTLARQKIEDFEQKAYLLRSIANIMRYRKKDPQTARELMKEAVATARQIESFYNKSQALQSFAVYFLRIDPQMKSELLDEALTAARQIENLNYKAYRLESLAQEFSTTDPQLASKLLEEAVTASRQIENPKEKGKVLRLIARTISYRDPQRAITISREMIEDPEQKVYTLMGIAFVRKDLQTAWELREEAVAVANQIENSKEKAHVLSLIASDFSITDPQRAREIAHQIDDSWQKKKTAALLEIAKKCKKTNPRMARELLDEAATAARQDERRGVLYHKALYLRWIAREFTEINPQTERELWNEGLAAARQMVNHSSKVRALLWFAEDSAKEDVLAASILFKEIAVLIDNLNYVEYDLLANLSKCHIEIKDSGNH